MKIFSLELNTQRSTDPEYDAELIKLEHSEKWRYYFLDPSTYNRDLLPNILYFDANFNALSKIDVPFTDSGIFIVSKKFLDIISNHIDFTFTEVKVIMLDDSCLKDRFDANLKLNPEIPINENFVALRFPKLESYFDFDNSVYRVPSHNPKAVRGIKKLVLKEPKDGFPAIFRTKETITTIFVREDLKLDIESNEVNGITFEEVSISSTP